MEGMLVVEMESWARLRPAREMSLVATKPAGVRIVDSSARSAARERSRRAFAFRRFSSCAWVTVEWVEMKIEGKVA